LKIHDFIAIIGHFSICILGQVFEELIVNKVLIQFKYILFLSLLRWFL